MAGEKERIEDIGLTSSGGGAAAPAGASEAPVVEQRSGKAVAALACGILSLIVFGFIFGPIAVVVGIIARREIAREPNLTGRGLALAGIILGILGFIASVIFVIVLGPSIFSGGGG